MVINKTNEWLDRIFSPISKGTRKVGEVAGQYLAKLVYPSREEEFKQAFGEFGESLPRTTADILAYSKGGNIGKVAALGDVALKSYANTQSIPATATDVGMFAAFPYIANKGSQAVMPVSRALSSGTAQRAVEGLGSLGALAGANIGQSALQSLITTGSAEPAFQPENLAVSTVGALPFEVPNLPKYIRGYKSTPEGIRPANWSEIGQPTEIPSLAAAEKYKPETPQTVPTMPETAGEDEFIDVKEVYGKVPYSFKQEKPIEINDKGEVSINPRLLNSYSDIKMASRIAETFNETIKNEPPESKGLFKGVFNEYELKYDTKESPPSFVKPNNILFKLSGLKTIPDSIDDIKGHNPDLIDAIAKGKYVLTADHSIAGIDTNGGLVGVSVQGDPKIQLQSYPITLIVPSNKPEVVGGFAKINFPEKLPLPDGKGFRTVKIVCNTPAAFSFHEALVEAYYRWYKYGYMPENEAAAAIKALAEAKHNSLFNMLYDKQLEDYCYSKLDAGYTREDLLKEGIMFSPATGHFQKFFYPDLNIDLDKLRFIKEDMVDKYYPITDIIKSSTLYNLYPDLRNYRILLDSKSQHLGYCNDRAKIIGVGFGNIKQTPEMVYDVILHEVDHALQSSVIEQGFTYSYPAKTEPYGVKESLDFLKQVITANAKDAGELKDSVLLFATKPDVIPPVADKDLYNVMKLYKQLTEIPDGWALHGTIPFELESNLSQRVPGKLIDTMKSLATSKYSPALFNLVNIRSSNPLIDMFRYLARFYNLKPEDTAILFSALNVYRPLLTFNPTVKDVKGGAVMHGDDWVMNVSPMIQLQPEVKAGPTNTAKLLSFRLARGLFESMQQTLDLKARLGIRPSNTELEFLKKRVELESRPDKEKVINEALKEFPPEIREEALKGDYASTLLGLEMLSTKPPKHLEDLEVFRTERAYMFTSSAKFVGTAIPKKLYDNYRKLSELPAEQMIEYTENPFKCAKDFGFIVDAGTREVIWVGEQPTFKPKKEVPPSVGEDREFVYYRGKDLIENIDKDFWVVIDKRKDQLMAGGYKLSAIDPRGRLVIVKDSEIDLNSVVEYAQKVNVIRSLPENKSVHVSDSVTPEVRLLAAATRDFLTFERNLTLKRPKIETLLGEIYSKDTVASKYLNLTSRRELETLFPSGFSDWVRTALAYKQLYGTKWLPAMLKFCFPEDKTIVSSLLLADPELASAMVGKVRAQASAGKGDVSWITFRPDQPMDVYHEFAHHFIDRHGAGALGEYTFKDLQRIYEDLTKYAKVRPLDIRNKQELLTEIYAIMLSEMKNDVKGIGLLSEATKDISQAEMFKTIVKSISLGNILKTIASERKNKTYIEVADKFYRHLTLDPYKAYIVRQIMLTDTSNFGYNINTSNPLWRRPKELGKELNWLDKLTPMSQLIKKLPELTDVAKLGRRVQSMVSEMVINLFGTGEDRFTQADINRLAKDKKIRDVFNILAFWSQTPSLDYQTIVKAREGKIDLEKAVIDKKTELTKTLTINQKMQIPEYRALQPEERAFVDGILNKASKVVERAAFARVRTYEKAVASTIASVIMTNKPDLKWSEAEELGRIALETGTVPGLDERLTKIVSDLAVDARASVARVKEVLLGDPEVYRFKSYLPEVRVGRYHINWTDLFGKRHYEAYYNLKDLEARLNEVRKEAHEYKVRDTMVDELRFAGMSKQALENFIDASQLLYKSAIDKINQDHPDAAEITKELQELFMPAKQMMELLREPYMKERRLVLGRERLDYIDSLVHYINSTANYTAKELARNQRRLLLADPELRANPSLREEARKYLAEIIDPKERTLTGLKNLMFVMTLGYNPSQAFIEMTQTLLTHIPVLVNEGSTIREAYSSVAGAFKDISGMLGHRGDFFERLKATKTLTPEEKNIITRAATEKVIDVGWLAELYKLEEDVPFLNYRRMLQGEKDTLSVTNVMGNAMYHLLWGARKFYSYSVVANQIAALLSSYRLYKSQGVKDPYQKAVDTTYETMFGGGKAVRPLFFLTGPLGPTIGGLMYILQSYTYNAITMQLRLAKNAITNTLPFTQRKQAMKAAALAFGTQMLAGGVLSLPFGANIMALIDQLFGTDIKRDLREMIVKGLDGSQITNDERTLGQFVADFAMDGLPAALGPVDISTRLQMGSLFGVDPYQGFTWNNLIGPSADVLEGMFIKTPQALAQGNIGEAASNFLPMGIRRFAKALANDLTVRTATGRLNFVPTPSELALMGLGFRPKRLADFTNLAEMSRKLQLQEIEQNREVADKVAEAIYKGDIATARQILDQQKDPKGAAERAIDRYFTKYVPYSPLQETPELAGLYPPTPTMPKEVRSAVRKNIMRRLGKFPKTFEETLDVHEQSRIYEPPRSPLQELLLSGQY